MTSEDAKQTNRTYFPKLSKRTSTLFSCFVLTRDTCTPFGARDLPSNACRISPGPRSMTTAVSGICLVTSSHSIGLVKVFTRYSTEHSLSTANDHSASVTDELSHQDENFLGSVTIYDKSNNYDTEAHTN